MRKPVKAVGRSAGKCINPKIGEHPDLFERDAEGRPAMTSVWTGPPVVGGQYREGMSRAQVRALPRDAFNEADWDSLDEADQEFILENDPESLARVKALVDAFVEREKYLTKPDEQTKQQWLNDDEEYFVQWLADQDEVVDDRSIKDEVEELVDTLAHPDDLEGDPRQRVLDTRGAINEALRDANNYDISMSGNEYRAEGLYKSRIMSAGGIYFDGGELRELTDPMFPDEIEEAVKQIKHDTYLHIKYDDLFPKYEFQQDYEVDWYFVATPDWDKIEAAARETLGVEEIEETAAPPEQRIVYRFKDGFYVQDLLSSELKAEGAAQGICVGQGQYGYAGAVKRGDTKIFSLRRPSGKPLFTIEASVDREGRVHEVRQVKGKANRLPGWDAGSSEEGKMKDEEVKKALEFVYHLGIDPWNVRDLRPAIDKIVKDRGEGYLPDSAIKKFLGPKKNPGRRLPPNDRPLGFDSPWTP